VIYITHRHARCPVGEGTLVAEDRVHASEFDPLRPDLREAAETLEQALSEACGSRPADEADTGELIRVEEMLAIASEAARRAISIRQTARAEAESMATIPLTPEDTADPSEATHRFFTDARSIRWNVWAVYPEARPTQLSLPGSFQTGWLVFESTGEKRRLSPIPAAWQSLPADELERLCEQADIAPRRTRTPGSGFGESTPPQGESTPPQAD
jgi:hypothetical protein